MSYFTSQVKIQLRYWRNTNIQCYYKSFTAPYEFNHFITTKHTHVRNLPAVPALLLQNLYFFSPEYYSTSNVCFWLLTWSRTVASHLFKGVGGGVQHLKFWPGLAIFYHKKTGQIYQNSPYYPIAPPLPPLRGSGLLNIDTGSALYTVLYTRRCIL